MSVLSDKWIRKMSLEHKMISPFVEKQERSNNISRMAYHHLVMMPGFLMNSKFLQM